MTELFQPVWGRFVPGVWDNWDALPLGMWQVSKLC